MLQLPMMILAALLVAPGGKAVVAPGSSSVREECRASAGGAFSFDVHLSAAAGGACLDDVEVFSGPGCEPAQRLWGDTRGCNETERMAISDSGNLISILAPAAARRDWSIVSVIGWDGERVTAVSISLDELPGTEGLRGVVRPVFEGAAIRFSADVLVSFEALESARGS